MNLKSKKQKKGFTLIEMLVSMTVFVLIVSSATGFFTSVLKAQRKLLATQEIFSQVSYLEEYVSRSIRMARKDLAGVCISARSNYSITHSGSGIKFLNYKGECQEFYLYNSKLMESKNSVVSELTSSALTVDDFNINVLGNSQSDNIQPRVTLFINVTGSGTRTEEQAEVQIQTTISQRKLDIQY